MALEELLVALFETMTDQLRLPEGYEWAPLAGLCTATGFGLLLLLRGARWAPGLAALTFLGIGGWAGSFLAGAVGTPFWLTVGVVGVVGCVLGVVMFRFWQALLLAACCVVAGLSVYYARDLTPDVQNWVSATGAELDLIALQPPGTVVGEGRPSALAELGSLWTHLDQQVPNFATTVWALVASIGLAGLVFGLLLPRASRALWAATLGTVFLGVGGTLLLKQFEPGAYDWLLADNARAWAIVGVVWLASFVLNLLTCRHRKPSKKPEKARTRAGAKPAVA